MKKTKLFFSVLLAVAMILGSMPMLFASADDTPAVPSNVTAKASGANQITVSWDASANATQYNIYRLNTQKNTYSYIGTTSAAAAEPTKFVNKNLTAGTTYTYKVVAARKSDAGTFVSAKSAAASAVALGNPAAPQNVKAEASAERQITVTWNAVADATQYNIYRLVEGNDTFSYRGTTKATAAAPTQYIDKGLTAGVRYTYKVIAVNKTADCTLQSSASAEVSAVAAISLAPPANVQAAATGDGEITVSWTAVADATQYNVYRWDDAQGKFKYYATVYATAANPTRYVNKNLTVGTTYRYYVVSVKKADGVTTVSTASAEVSAKAVNLLAPPADVQAAASGDKQITVSWSAVAEATQYNVYRWDDAQGKFKYYATVYATAANPTRYVNKNLTVGTTYRYYVVSVKKADGKTTVSDPSAEASAVCALTPPANVQAAATADKTITVSWSAVAEATQYNIYRSVSLNGTYSYKGTTRATAEAPTQFVNTGLTAGTTYYYKVTAVLKEDGNTFVSAYSEPAEATALGKPAVPQGVTATAGGTDSIIVAWDAVADATQYNIYRSASLNGTYSYKGTTYAAAEHPTQYINTGLTAGTTYYYKVVAVKKAAITLVSDKSAAAEARTLSIVALSDGDISLSATCFQYDGTVKQPVVTVTADGAVLTPDADYTLAFSGDCIENGAYTVTVTGAGRFTGTASAAFVISESGHTPEVMPAVEETCTQDGLTEGVRCAVCGTILTAQEPIPAPGHDMAPTEAKAAKCTEDGNSAYYTCGRCGGIFTDAEGDNETTLEAVTIAALGHRFYWYHYPATCTVNPFQEKKCTRCGNITETIFDYDTDPLEHQTYIDEDQSLPATCTEDGYNIICCSRTFDVEVYDANNETYVSTLEGFECEYTDNQPLPALGHLGLDDSAWYGDTATCLLGGVEYNDTCSRCDVATRETQPLGHDVTGQTATTVTAATCTEWGVKTKVCNRCQQPVEFPIEPAHTFGSPKQKFNKGYGNCLLDGYSISICSKGCTVALDDLAVGDVVKTSVAKSSNGASIAKSKYGMITAIAGEGDDRIFTVNFAALGKPDVSIDYAVGEFTSPVAKVTIDAVGPDEGHVATLAEGSRPRTCTEDGVYIYSGNCTKCSMAIDAQTITVKAVGHIPYDDANDPDHITEPTCTEPVYCKVCKSGIAIDALGHDYSVPNCALSQGEVNGFYCRRCGKLEDTVNERIATLRDLLALIKSGAYEMDPEDPTAPHKQVTQLSKSKMATTYTTFDFGIWTSTAKSMFAEEFNQAQVSYNPAETSGIKALLPFAGRAYAIKSTFNADDIDVMKIERINGFNTNSILSVFTEAPTGESAAQPDISRYYNKTLTETVLKVTLDITDEYYARTGSNFDTTAADTHASKVFRYDIRQQIPRDMVDPATWQMTEEGDGYNMTMTINSLADSTVVTYYFNAETYEPIAATYHISETMTQDITMTLMSIDGVIKPVVRTDRDFVYLFEDYFN